MRNFSNLNSKGVQIYNNGPLSNSTATGAGGADESIMQSSLGAGSYGFGCQLSGTTRNRVAEDFYVNATSWDIDSLVFFAYQTGSGLTSTFTAVNVRVWDGVPNAPGSSVVWGDTLTNVLDTTYFSGVYRVGEGSSGNSDRPIMRLVCATPGLSLTGGIYWVDYQTEGSGASGPWAPPIVITGQTNTGNAIQRISYVWDPIVDVDPQGLPFEVFGTANGSFTDDIGVVAIIKPISSATLTNAEDIEVVISNFGSVDQTGFQVAYSINGQTPITDIFSGNLPANSSANYTFNNPPGGDFSVGGQFYNIKAYTELLSDQMNINDTAYKTIQNLFGVVCSAGATTCDEYIDDVTFSNLSNTLSGCGLVGGYSDFTTDTAHIDIGSTYTLTVYNPEAYSGDQVGAWFDWNQNGDLNETGEFYMLTTSDFETFTANITVPNWAINGDALMRVRIQYGGTLSPCGVTSYGEVEDYTINIGGAGIACDVATNSIDVNSSMAAGSIDPKATFSNYGYDNQTFDVTLIITPGGYTSTKTITSLAPGNTQQVTFDSWTASLGQYSFEVYTTLGCDSDNSNDTITKAVNVLVPENIYVYVAYDETDILPEGPGISSLQIPGVITSLAPTTSTEFICAGAWAENKWYAAEYKDGSSGGRLYTIDTVTGAMTVVGQMGVQINGISYDPVSKIMYGVSSTALYQINIASGGASFIGDCGISNSVFVGLACNTQGELYTYSLDDAKLYKLNSSTGAATLIGSIGFDPAYSQDMEFDNKTGILYMAAYNYDTDAGELRTVNTTTGATTLIGPFMNNAEICGLAISYPPITSIAENNTSFELSIYPNPANDFVNINSNEIIKAVRIINTLGQIISDNVIGSLNTQINTSSIDKGVYFIQIDTEKGTQTNRLIINR